MLIPNHSQLVAELRKIRTAQGLTAKQLSSKVYGEGNSISAVENNRKQISVVAYMKICKVLRVSPMRIIANCNGSNKVKSHSNVSKHLHSKRGRPRKNKVYAQDLQPQTIPQDTGLEGQND